MKMQIIELSKMEFEFACFIGLQRTTARMYGGSLHAYGADVSKGLFDSNLGGAIAEYAVAKYLGCYWSQQPENMRLPDVGGIVEVRSTPHADGLLRLHDRDKDEAPYVLALTYDLPKVHLVGWIVGKDGKSQQYWGDKWSNGRPAFWVPQTGLLPMDELKTRYWAWANKKGG
ncbi:MAG: hypothetical protein EB015_11710 [Methylocystaceae bacterium]|nr:hypothetical protein [Methylocystaceae bacterium]